MIQPGAYALSEGKYIIGFDKIFKPVLEAVPKLIPGDLLVEIQPFLIVTPTDYILLDAGLGFLGANGQPIIINNLTSLGVQPHQITKIILSHLHHDHIGGLINVSNNKANFSNAIHFIQYEEWQYAFQNNGLSYPTQKLILLQNEVQINWLYGNENLNEQIYFEMSGGHTPYHQVIQIHNQSNIFFYGGDVLPQLAQLHYNFKAKYDFDGAQSLAMRQQYAIRGQHNKWTFLFFHDLKSPFHTIS
jgi:glyoxylase-like metal-dependent hydrolase (beta-lactamase superfamily II)